MRSLQGQLNRTRTHIRIIYLLTIHGHDSDSFRSGYHQSNLCESITSCEYEFSRDILGLQQRTELFYVKFLSSHLHMRDLLLIKPVSPRWPKP